MISCTQAVRQLWEYLDGSADASDRAAIEAHLALCRRCCGELEFARELRVLLARVGSESIPDDVMSRLNETLQRIDQEGTPTR